MTKDKWICLALIGFWLLLPCSTVRGDENFEYDLKSRIVSSYNLDAGKTEIEFRRNPLVLDRNQYDSLELVRLSEAPLRGILPLQILAYKGGQLVAKGQIRIKIARYEYVLVTAERIRRHDMITPDKYNIQRMEITSLTDKPLTNDSELVSKWTKISLNRGQILTSGLVEEVPLIKAGQGVAIRYKTSGFEIMARGIAMESGYRGNSIRVKNNQSGKIIKGIILDGEAVKIETL
ncbi:MAG: flagellar basal body P-ring formation chaperone FlgA [candidate division Zixibacteria bacterium]|nr:flagellar basal body P-ring formation chaperone FlgA [candidate division Zixibacteria bacterium]